MSYEEIPYASEQGISCGLTGNQVGDQGIFQPDQGIPDLGSSRRQFAVNVVA
jgi:hypothetical protein